MMDDPVLYAVVLQLSRAIGASMSYVRDIRLIQRRDGKAYSVSLILHVHSLVLRPSWAPVFDHREVIVILPALEFLSISSAGNCDYEDRWWMMWVFSSHAQLNSKTNSNHVPSEWGNKMFLVSVVCVWQSWVEIEFYSVAFSTALPCSKHCITH